MDFRCPHCKTDLKHRYLPTQGLDESILALPPPIHASIKRRVVLCPHCRTSLVAHVHPFDRTGMRWAPLPLIVFFTGLLLQARAIEYLAGVMLVIGVAWALRTITRPSYRAWRYWQAHVSRDQDP